MIATLALLTAAMRFEIASKPYVDLYFRVRSVADAELAAWIAYLDGKTSRDEAVVKIVASVSSTRIPR